MRHRRNHRLPLSICLFALTWFVLSEFCSGQNVILHLHNGDRISGKIISETSTNILVNTTFAGNLAVAKDQIARRELSSAANQVAPAIAASSNSAPAFSTAKASPPPAVTQKPPAANTTNAVGMSSFRRFLSEWRGELEVGVNLGYSTKERQTYSGRFKAVHSHPMANHRTLRNTLDYLFAYGTTDGVLVDNRMDGSWKTDYELGKRFLVYNATGGGYDQIRKIDLQYDVGPGVGYKLVTRTNFVLQSELGGNYQQQFFADNTEHSRYSLRLAEESWWRVFSKLRIDEKIEFFPEITDFSDFRVRTEGNLSYLLLDNLTFKLTVIDLYETGPARNVSNNDLQIRSSVGIKF